VFVLLCLVGSCYIMWMIVWKLSPDYKLDERFLQVAPDDYDVSEIILSNSKSNKECPNALCEYWNFLSQYLCDPSNWLRSLHEFQFLGHIPRFHLKLPFPAFNVKDIRSGYQRLYETAETFRRESIFKDIFDTKTVIYLNSGADFLRAYALYPFASRYILISEEFATVSQPIPLSNQYNIDTISSDITIRLDVLLSSINNYLTQLCINNKQWNEFYENNIFPYLLAQLHLTGHHIIQVKQHTDDSSILPINCIEITFSEPNDSFNRSLVYVSSSLSNFNPNGFLFKRLFGSQPSVIISGTKFGYFGHYNQFLFPQDCTTKATTEVHEAAERLELFISKLLRTSNYVIQNEHGIPLHWFSESRITSESWKTKSYGNPGPILGEHTFLNKEFLNYAPSPETKISLENYQRLHCETDSQHSFDHLKEGLWVTANVNICSDQYCNCPLTSIQCANYTSNSNGFIMVHAKP